LHAHLEISNEIAGQTKRESKILFFKFG